MHRDHSTPAARTLFDISPERWAPIEGWAGYDVSDLGRVRSFWGPGGKGHGQRAVGTRWKLRNLTPGREGYLCVKLCRDRSREWRTAKVHHLVLEAFVGPRPPGQECCHEDGDPGNNRLENLRWGTPAANLADRLRLRDGRSFAAKLSPADVVAIWPRLVAGEAIREIAGDYGVSIATIRLIRSGKCRGEIVRHLPGFPLIEAPTAEPVYSDPEFILTPSPIWLPLPDWPAYRVSNWGEVMSCWKFRSPTGRRPGPRWWLSDEWRAIKAAPNAMGYRAFSVGAPPCRRTVIAVHVAVLRAFVGPAPRGLVGCHNDGNPLNNLIGNLRWDTHGANRADYLRHSAERANHLLLS